MSYEESVTQWIESLREGDDDAAEAIWRRYFTQLCELARRRLPGNLRTSFDEEDVALSAIDCLFDGIKQDKFSGTP